MRAAFKMTALLTAAAFVLGLSGVARADDRHHRRGMSTTEKVFTGIAAAAAIGLTAYALSKGRPGGVHFGYSQHSPRRFVGFDIGFRSYSVGGPHGLHHRHPPRGYWINRNGMRFWRTPYVYNPRFDAAFNAGWERGYWAGYVQGLHDARMRARYYDQFHRDGNMWGYSSRFGSYRSYETAFGQAFRTGYRHGFQGYAYGANSFGFSVRTNNRW